MFCCLFMSCFDELGGGEGEMLYCITNRLNKGLISVDRNKRMLLYYLQYPVPTFKSSAKDLSRPIFGIVFQRATDTACFAAPARLKFMALEKHRLLYLCACNNGQGTYCRFLAWILT